MLISLLVFYFFAWPSIKESYKSNTSIFDSAKKRGYITCGVNESLQYIARVGGEVSTGPDGVKQYDDAEGFNADYCKAIAVALFGGYKSTVRFRKVTWKEGFKPLNDGIVDVLIRSYTATIGREIAYGVEFGPTIFYDRPGILIGENEPPSESQAAEGDMKYLVDKTVCVTPGTTTEKNVVDWAKTVGNVTVKTRFSDDEEVDNKKAADYINGPEYGCDAVASDRSQLVGRMDNSENKLRILDIEISGKEPLAPVYVAGDTKWATLVDTVIHAVNYAAEIGIARKELSLKSKTKPDGNRLVYENSSLVTEEICLIARSMGLDPYFVFDIVKEVGNYDDIYGNIPEDRIDRGLNQTYASSPGLYYPLPFSYPDDKDLDQRTDLSASDYEYCKEDNLKIWSTSQ